MPERAHRTRGKGRITLFCNVCKIPVPRQDPLHYVQHMEEWYEAQKQKRKKRLLG